jgi:hypothetical protein
MAETLKAAVVKEPCMYHDKYDGVIFSPLSLWEKRGNNNELIGNCKGHEEEVYIHIIR